MGVIYLAVAGDLQRASYRKRPVENDDARRYDPRRRPSSTGGRLIPSPPAPPPPVPGYPQPVPRSAPSRFASNGIEMISDAEMLVMASRPSR